MYYQQFDRSMGLWIIIEFLKLMLTLVIKIGHLIWGSLRPFLVEGKWVQMVYHCNELSFGNKLEYSSS